MLKLTISRAVFVGLPVTTLMVMITACAQPPLEQFQAAQKAIEAARAAGAEEYASDDFAKLKQEFKVAQKELAGPAKLLLLTQSFSDTEKLLVKVLGDAEHVMETASQSKGMAKATAVTLEQEAKAVVTVAEKLISTSSRGKDKPTLDAVKRGLQMDLTEVHRLIEKSDYLAAQIQARRVKENGLRISLKTKKAISKQNSILKSPMGS